jgi:hypothetical protein
MQAETARMLMESIANATAIAIDNQNKLTALEAAPSEVRAESIPSLSGHS